MLAAPSSENHEEDCRESEQLSVRVTDFTGGTKHWRENAQKLAETEASGLIRRKHQITMRIYFV